MYFKIESTIEIVSIEQLMKLTMKVNYGKPGIPNKLVAQPGRLATTFSTAGIFRGQVKNWELIPSSYRNSNDGLSAHTSNKSYRYSVDNEEFFAFSEMASRENSSFPKREIEQMMIAQHYGIKTPLLDWTQNIFVAIYFALDLKSKENEDLNLQPYIYHIRDERLLKKSRGITKTKDIEESLIVSPIPIDRRIERQFSMFTFHPHPSTKPKKIPVDVYIISEKLYMKLWRLMEGMGFSSSHYFPDYAGLSERIKQGYMI